jgi:Tol biopolymer transport system component
VGQEQSSSIEKGRYQVKKKFLAVNILLGVVVLLAGSITAAVAVAAQGTGPDNARVPSHQWQPLNAGDSYWYAFEYGGDGSQIEVRLEVEPAEGAAFQVWTPGEIERWRLGLEANPIGRGSVDPSTAKVFVWSGSFNDVGTYYVVVEHAGNQPGTSYYLLSIDGEGVSLSTSTPTPPATSEPNEAESKSEAPSEPTGKLVFQTSMGGDIYTIDVDGSGLQRITDGMDPVWSPDGEQIAFIRWREPRGVWVIDAGGSDERRIFDWSEARYPSWSPDGGQIVFSRQAGGTEEREFCFRGRCFSIPARTFWKLGIVNPGDGGFVEPLPNSDVSQTPDWSPAGDQIAFDAVHGLTVQSVDGTVSYQMTDAANDTNPVWSPDGSKIAFTRRQHDHWEVYVVTVSGGPDAGGGRVQRLTTTPKKPNGEVASSAAPAWSPDGNHIAFLTDRAGTTAAGGEWEIWVMRADGSAQRPMFGSELDGIALDYASLGERAISWTE